MVYRCVLFVHAQQSSRTAFCERAFDHCACQYACCSSSLQSFCSLWPRRKVVAAGEPNRAGSYGTISVMEGLVIGLFTGVFSHLVVPGAVFVVPTLIE